MAERGAKYTLTTRLTPVQVREALAATVVEGPLWTMELSGGSDGRAFRGEVRDSGFRLVRRVVGRNSFVPVVTGEVREAPGGAEVQVTMALPPLAVAFVAGWVAVTAGLLVWFIATLPRGASPGPALALLPFPLVAPGIGWVMFNHEVRQATRFLEATLPAPDAALAPEAPPAVNPGA